jgi:hypothetical protein
MAEAIASARVILPLSGAALGPAGLFLPQPDPSAKAREADKTKTSIFFRFMLSSF